MSTTSVEPREPRPATAGEFVIHTESLTKVYPGSTPIKAVDSLDLSIHPGEIFGLLGPNGAGKTTTVGMLTTRIVPTGGGGLWGGGGGVGIGGVLEPVNAAPVVIEDDVIVGGNCGIFEGTVVRSRAVIGAGVVLTRGTPVYDLVRETIYRGDSEKPLEIPSDAVVVPGARQVNSDLWGGQQGISLQTPVIVKYRDEKTDSATTLENWLR